MSALGKLNRAAILLELERSRLVVPRLSLTRRLLALLWAGLKRWVR